MCLDSCGSNSICNYNRGHFHPVICDCMDGYMGSPCICSQLMLNVFHVIIVYLAFCENNGACQRNSTCYFNSLYGPGCKCNRGYEYNIYLNTCDPINICLSNATTCPANSTCESTGPRTSICNCHQGYTMNSTQHCVISKQYFPFDIS